MPLQAIIEMKSMKAEKSLLIHAENIFLNTAGISSDSLMKFINKGSNMSIKIFILFDSQSFRMFGTGYLFLGERGISFQCNVLYNY